MDTTPKSAVQPAWCELNREELKLEIENSVQLEQTPIRLGGRDFDWYRVADPESLLEIAAAGNDPRPAEEVDPFWAATWRAALGLDRFLGQLEIRQQRILELGCGSGQAGTGAAARGALVTLTDSVELALKVAKLNSWPVTTRVQFKQLLWGKAAPLQEQFSIIIGSDLVYDPAHFPALEACARQHLEPAGKMYLSEPHRHTGDVFSKWIRNAGWTSIEHDIDLQDQRVPVRIFECFVNP